MRRWVRLVVLLAGSASIAAGIEIADPGSRWAPLALIGGAIAAGELLELKPPLRAALPISFAFMVVLARQASIPEGALVLVIAELAAFLVRSEPASVEGRLALFVERLVEGMAAVLVYHGLIEALGEPPMRGKVLFALAVAAIAPLAHRRDRADGARTVLLRLGPRSDGRRRARLQRHADGGQR